ncbi:NUDIX domain-containing protein [Patescibacteria group bacterium]|jgi:8-oxo-dGTP pyrophosphatase MutT (NUDIX family)|nr:NUDIX domain-containing protein [Patescibacteria group bacterium]
MPKLDVYPRITISDDRDTHVQYIDFHVALREGLVRRVSRVFLVAPSGEIYLQRRGSTLKILPGHWDISAGGHVDEGDSYYRAAQKEVLEELGIPDVLLTTLGKWYVAERFEGHPAPAWHMLYKAVHDGGDLVLDPYEVAEGAWFSPQEIDQLVAGGGEPAAPTLVANWRDCRAMLC